MKVFISWSGEVSGKVARALRDWLPYVIHSIQPYVSSEDIQAGQKWGAELAGELETAGFGILCVTRDNAAAPWLNFEAGALSKSIKTDVVNRVCPFLFGLTATQLSGPLQQFQSIGFHKEGIRKLVFSLNAASGEEGVKDSRRLEESFNVWWPKLEDELNPLYKLVNKKILWLFESSTQRADAEISAIESQGYGSVNRCYLDRGELDALRPDCDLAVYVFGKTDQSAERLRQVTAYLVTLGKQVPLIVYTYHAAGDRFLVADETAILAQYPGQHVMAGMPMTLLERFKTIG